MSGITTLVLNTNHTNTFTNNTSAKNIVRVICAIRVLIIEYKNLSIERPMLKRNVLRYMELLNCQPKVKTMINIFYDWSHVALILL